MGDIVKAVLRALLEGFCANVMLPAWMILILLKDAAKEAARYDGD